MKYMTRWSISEDNFAAAVKRFTKSNPEPPPGVKMLGRWHEMGSGDGFALFEVDDQVAFTKFILAWADLVDQKVYPVVDDGEVGEALQG